MDTRITHLQQPPDPLDPSKVRPGDRVTLEIFQLPYGRYTVSADAFYDEASGTVCAAGHPVDPDGTYVLALTAHQPGPEPEWPPATLAEATVHGYRGIRVWRVEGGEPSSGWTTHVPVEDATWHSDSDVTDVRPLVVIDPTLAPVEKVVEATRAAWYAQPVDMTHADSDARWLHAVRAGLAELGIKVGAS